MTDIVRDGMGVEMVDPVDRGSERNRFQRQTSKVLQVRVVVEEPGAHQSGGALLIDGIFFAWETTTAKPRLLYRLDTETLPQG